MDYSKLSQGEIFACKVKCTYTEIYLHINGYYHKVFSIQKKDYAGVIGYGEKIIQNNDLVPITMTDEALRFILYKAGYIDEKGNRIGILQPDTSSYNNQLVNKDIADISSNYPLAKSDDITQGYDPNDRTIIPTNNTQTTQTTQTFNYFSQIDDVDVVYVKSVAIDCQKVSEDEVEIEDIFEDSQEKDYSKLIWIALGAAALLL